MFNKKPGGCWGHLFLLSPILLPVLLSGCKDKNEIPHAKKVIAYDTIGSNILTDEYKWLENLKDTSVLNYVKAENAYTKQYFSRIQNLSKTLFNELKRLNSKNTNTLKETHTGHYIYYFVKPEHQDYNLLYRRKESIKSNEELLLDENLLAAGSKHFALDDYKVSNDEEKLSVLYTLNGDSSLLRIRDIREGKFIDNITDVNNEYLWADKDEYIIYVNTQNAVVAHRPGSNHAKDLILYHESDPNFMVSLDLSESGKYIFITSYNNQTTEVRYLPSDLRLQMPELIEKRKFGQRYFANHYGGDTFWILTNFNAPDNKIVKVSARMPGIKNWKDVEPGKTGRIIQDYSLMNGRYLIITENEKMRSRIRIIDLLKNMTDFFEIPGGMKDLEITDFNPAEESVNVKASSYLSPAVHYKFDCRNRVAVMISKDTSDSYNPDDFSEDLKWVTADDGVQIPVVLMYKKGMVRDSKNPAILWAYGCYGAAKRKSLHQHLIPMLNRGFIIAFAYVRGGGELGATWHEDGCRLKKKRSFEDFICCAEFLIDSSYTSKGLISIDGGSAGGLLIASVVNSKPELFKCAILDVPFVDPLRSLADSSENMSNPNEWYEFGNPNIPEYYKYISSYSPYENIRPRAYPAMFIITGLLDENVSCTEPIKMTARLRQLKTDHNILLLKTELSGTHFGESGKDAVIKHQSEVWAFILQEYTCKPAR